jgi:transposase
VLLAHRRSHRAVPHPAHQFLGGGARHRLPRGGDRQLNLALHIAALTQVRMRGSLGRAYYDRKIAEGKTRNEAMRCLKRRLADHVWRIMLADERGTVRAAGPGGHSGATLTSSAAGSTPTTSSSDKSLPGPAKPQPTTSDPAA